LTLFKNWNGVRIEIGKDLIIFSLFWETVANKMFKNGEWSNSRNGFASNTFKFAIFSLRVISENTVEVGEPADYLIFLITFPDKEFKWRPSRISVN